MSDEQTAEVLAMQDGPQENAEESETAKAETAGDKEPQANENEGDTEHERKRLGGWQRKIQKLEKRLEEKDELLSQLLRNGGDKTAKSEEKKTELTDEPPVKPKLSDFDTYDAFEDARDAYYTKLAKYEAKQAVAAYKAESRKDNERQTVADTFRAQVEEFSKDHPDFAEVAYSKDVPMTEAMKEAIVTSEHGAAVAYYLGQNPHEAEKISEMSPVAAIRAIGQIEARIARDNDAAKEPEQEEKPAKPPKPPTPVRKATPTAAKDLNDPNMPMEEWVKLRNKQVYGR